jgi:hypothetical protein
MWWQAIDFALLDTIGFFAGSALQIRGRRGGFSHRVNHA